MNINKIINSKCVEPEKRNKDGYKWIIHRFPIKGGISMRDVWIRNLNETNPLFKRLIEAKKA